MSQMNFAAAERLNQQRVQMGAKSLVYLLGLGISPLILLWLDRPSWHRSYETSGVRQAIATLMLIVGWVFVGVLWLTVPLAGFVAWLVGLLSTSRRVAGFSGAPVTVSDFLKTMALPGSWNWAWVAIIGLPLASAIWSTVRLDFIPESIRTMGDNLAIAAMLAGVAIAVFSGVRMTAIYRKHLSDQATLSTSVAAMLGAPARIFEDGHASFSFDGDRLIVRPHSTVDLAGVEARLAGTSLGEQFSVTYKGFDAIALEPISETELDRIRTMRASGGLVQGHTDLVAKPVDEQMLALDASDDDPWGASEPVVVETPAEDGTVTMGSEAWS